MSFYVIVALYSIVLSPFFAWVFISAARKEGDITIGILTPIVIVSFLPIFREAVLFVASGIADKVVFKRKVK